MEKPGEDGKGPTEHQGSHRRAESGPWLCCHNHSSQRKPHLLGPGDSMGLTGASLGRETPGCLGARPLVPDLSVRSLARDTYQASLSPILPNSPPPRVTVQWHLVLGRVSMEK